MKCAPLPDEFPVFVSRRGRSARSARLSFQATVVEVRSTLTLLHDLLRSFDLAPCEVEVAELVLAEVLNNVVEHAFAGITPGLVGVELLRLPGSLECKIRDTGWPMPHHALPCGSGVTLDRLQNELPEGGFGWDMIKSLTQGLRYRRAAGQNLLSLSIRLGGQAV